MSEGTINQVLDGEAQWSVVHSDCLDVLRTMPDECVDAIVTDAPYGLSKITEENVRDALACWLRGEPYLSKSRGFMGRTWDRFVPGPEVWRECCRVLRPGGYLLTFAGTRTEDLMGIALRLGGLERVDTLAWLHGCLSADTEALTRRGWLRYDQISDDDEVMQWESSTGSLSWVRPLRVVSYDYDGELINIRNRHTDQLLTPNHRVYCTAHKHSGTRGWAEPSVIEAANLVESQSIDLPMAGSLGGGDPFDPELAYLVGWWLTDAWAHSGVKAVMFSQSKPRTLERLRSALGSHPHSEYVKKAGSPNHNDEHTFYVSGKLADFLLENFSDRELHWDVLGWPAEARKRLFDGLMDGDGSMPEGDHSQTFWSKRQARRDVFVALCLSLGMRCYDDPVKGAVYVNTATSTTQVVSRHRKAAPPVHYSGKVWCVTVPTGAFVVRRNGRPFITGNSGFPKSVNIERQIAMHQCTLPGRHFASTLPKGAKRRDGDHLCPETEESLRWKGYGSATKPAHEPVLCARKPLRGVPLSTILVESELLLGGLLCQCLLSVNNVDLFSVSNQSEPEAPVSALILAAVCHGASLDGWKERMATFSSRELVETCSNIAMSWRDISVELCDPTSTCTTETVFALTTALRTSNSLISQIMHEGMVEESSRLVGRKQCACTAESGSCDERLSLRDTLSRIAQGNATLLQGSRSANTVAENIAPVVRAVDSVLENATGYIEKRRSGPSHEPILCCRKPLRGTYAENVLANGTAMSIDACRVAHAGSADLEQHAAGVAAIKARGGSMDESWKNSSDLSGANDVTSAGRWPPNALISHEPGCRRVGTRTVAANPTWDTPNRDTEPSAFTGETVSRVRHGRGTRPGGFCNVGADKGDPVPCGPTYDVEDIEVWECVDGCAAKALGEMSGDTSNGEQTWIGGATGPANGTTHGNRAPKVCFKPADSGTATRFFPQFPADDEPTFLYQAKPSRREKDAGLQQFRPRTAAEATHSEDGQQRLESPRTGAGRTGGARNNHPTSKSVDLCRWLTRLVARPGQVVLNPFAGGGSEGVAAVLEGCRWVGVEINDSEEEPFVSIARARLTHIDGGEFVPRESLRAPVNERPKQATLFG